MRCTSVCLTRGHRARGSRKLFHIQNKSSYRRSPSRDMKAAHQAPQEQVVVQERVLVVPERRLPLGGLAHADNRRGRAEESFSPDEPVL